MLKLNIGAGDTHIDGYAPVDIKDGIDAAKLPYEDGAVDEIYACHVLEHFALLDVPGVLKEWCRVLKPGGVLRVSVPDIDKLIEVRNDPHRKQWASRAIVGGWTDENDRHGSVFDGDSLRDALYAAGFGRIQEFESFANDNSASDISINLEGRKRWWSKKDNYTVTLVLCQPRTAYTDHMEAMIRTSYQIGATRPNFRFTVVKSKGAFWDRDIECAVEDAIDNHNPDILLFSDFDSVYSPEDVFTLIDTLIEREDVAGVGAVQMSRHNDKPLVMEPDLDYSTETTEVRFHHFGLTVIRADAFKEMDKPWFWSIPGRKPDGTHSWREYNRTDADITFWRQFRTCGFKMLQHNRVVIGHIIEGVKWPCSTGSGVIVQPLHNYLTSGKPFQAVLSQQVYAVADADKVHAADYWNLTEYQPGYEWLRTYAGGWQYGEQKMLLELAQRGGVDKGDWCVEIGAGDGVTLPITAAHLIAAGMPGILVESDPERCKLLRKVLPARCRVIEDEAQEWNVADLIAGRSVGVLVIDTDGNEYDILNAIECEPKIICVEHRDRVDNGDSISSQRTHHEYQKWADENGYEVAAITRVNTIMVRSDVAEKVGG